MTPDQITLAQHLVKARFQPGSWDKRFARDICACSHATPWKELSDNQRRMLYQQVVRYRRSLDKVYVKLAKDLLAAEVPSETRDMIDAPKDLPRDLLGHVQPISQLGLPG